MSDFRMALPKITWGAAFANTLAIGYPLDGVLAGSEPRAGFETAQAASGVEDSWDAGTDYVLEADVRWIPQVDTVTPAATGWDGTTGFRAFLEWAQRKNQIRFYPDAGGGTYLTCYLVEPLGPAGERETDGTRRVRLKLRNGASAFDGY